MHLSTSAGSMLFSESVNANLLAHEPLLAPLKQHPFLEPSVESQEASNWVVKRLGMARREGKGSELARRECACQVGR